MSFEEIDEVYYAIEANGIQSKPRGILQMYYFCISFECTQKAFTKVGEYEGEWDCSNDSTMLVTGVGRALVLLLPLQFTIFTVKSLGDGFVSFV